MSAQRRTAETGQGTVTGLRNTGTKAVAETDGRPPRPVVPKVAAEPKQGLAKRWDDLKESYFDTVAELKKVNWPDRETTKNLTLVVIAMSVVLGLLLGGIDYVLQAIFTVVP